MTPCCTNCLHWDEESAEDNVEGLGFCVVSESRCVSLHPSPKREYHVIARTRGDYSCPDFQGKTVPVVGEGTDKSSVQRD